MQAHQSKRVRRFGPHSDPAVNSPVSPRPERRQKAPGCVPCYQLSTINSPEIQPHATICDHIRPSNPVPINYQLSTINSPEIRPYATISDHIRPSACLLDLFRDTLSHTLSESKIINHKIINQKIPMSLIPLPDQLASPNPGEGGSENVSPTRQEPRSATTNRRRLGMVARLPYAVRHKLNLLMRRRSSLTRPSSRPLVLRVARIETPVISRNGLRAVTRTGFEIRNGWETNPRQSGGPLWISSPISTPANSTKPLSNSRTTQIFLALPSYCFRWPHRKSSAATPRPSPAWFTPMARASRETLNLQKISRGLRQNQSRRTQTTRPGPRPFRQAF